MKKHDYEVNFARLIVISVLVFTALLYGNRYDLNYYYVILAEISLFVFLLKIHYDEGQETITALICTTCAIMISTLCSQTRMNLGLVILTYVACLLGDAIILYSEQSHMQDKVYPLLVLAYIFVSNIKNETYIKLGTVMAIIGIVIVYGIYFYRAVIKEKIIQQKNKMRKNSK